MCVQDGALIIRLCAVLFSDLLPFFCPCCFRVPVCVCVKQRGGRHKGGELRGKSRISGYLGGEGGGQHHVDTAQQKRQIFGVALLCQMP